MHGMYRLLMRMAESAAFFWTARTLFLLWAKIVKRLRVTGQQHVPREGGCVVAVNHFSSLDPPMMGVSVPREISFMAKKELFEPPALRLLVRGLRAFPVDREGNDVSAVKEALRRLKAGRPVGVFIQGTRNATDAAALDGASFLAQRAQVPLVPAGIWKDHGAYRVAFGAPFEVAGRDRTSIQNATQRTVRDINALLPSHTQILAPLDEGVG